MTTTAQKLNKTLLGEIADITSSKRIFASDYVSEGIPFYRSREVIERQKGNDISTELYISKEKFESIKNKFGVPKKDDLLITSVGTLGVPYVVGENEVFYFKDGNLIWLRDFKKNIASPKFIYYAILNPETQQRLKGISIGSSQSAFTISALKDFYVLLPDISSQEKVVDILASYDSLIENNTRRIQILEQMAQEIYTEWLSKKENISRVGKLSDVGKLIRKKYNEKTDRDLPLVDMARMKTKSLSLSEFGKSTDLTTSRVIFEEGDILFGSIRAYLHKVTLAPFKGITNTSVFVFRPIKINLASFLTITLFRKETIAWANQYSTGTKMPVIKSDLFLTMPVSIPKEDVLKRLEEIINPMLEEIKNLTVQNFNLRKTRDLLLPKLITGEIKI